MRVCVVGLGYIGFPTACLIAQAGHDTIGVDVDARLVRRLEAGELHIVNESGLADLARDAVASGRLTFSSVIQPADVFIIAVPTPFQTSREVKSTDGAMPYIADLSFVQAASQAIASVIRPGNLVILESTVPPGTTEDCVINAITMAGLDSAEFMFAHAPERVLPGNIVHELRHNDRIVGGITPESGSATAAFYETFVSGRVVLTNSRTAEMVKLMENTYRDVNIALANELALVCESVGIDVWEAINLANLHPRVNFLRPGPGVGGHCIAVDPYFIVEAAPSVTPLIQTARHVNREMLKHVLTLFEALTKGVVVNKVAVLGASYKANVGDDRESPALEVVALLQQKGLSVEVHDPFVARYAGLLEDVLADASVILLLTDHSAYRVLEPISIANTVSHRLLLDARGCLDADAWGSAGFTVVQLGAPIREHAPR